MEKKENTVKIISNKIIKLFFAVFADNERLFFALFKA